MFGPIQGHTPRHIHVLDFGSEAAGVNVKLDRIDIPVKIYYNMCSNNDELNVTQLQQFTLNHVTAFTASKGYI